MMRPADFPAGTLERIRNDCRETGKAYYRATIVNGKPVIGQRVEDETW